MQNIVVIGNGGFLLQCLDVIRRTPEAALSLVITDPAIASFTVSPEAYCKKNDIPFLEAAKINEPSVLEAVRQAEPTFLFSIYNLRIIRDELLSIPSVATVNFHNSPLPRYRGLNVCAWAIINGEQEYGISWHYVTPGVDEGDLIEQRLFPIDPAETSLTLSRKCFAEGVKGLADFLPRLLSGQVKPIKQNPDEATYFSRKDIPNGGRVDFNWPYEKFERFIRGLNYFPLPNPFVDAKAILGDRPFFIQQVSRLRYLAEGDQAGKVVALKPGQIEVCIGDCVVGVTDVLNADAQPTTVDELIQDYDFKLGAIVA